MLKLLPLIKSFVAFRRSSLSFLRTSATGTFSHFANSAFRLVRLVHIWTLCAKMLKITKNVCCWWKMHSFCKHFEKTVLTPSFKRKTKSCCLRAKLFLYEVFGIYDLDSTTIIALSVVEFYQVGHFHNSYCTTDIWQPRWWPPKCQQQFVIFQWPKHFLRTILNQG